MMKDRRVELPEELTDTSDAYELPVHTNMGKCLDPRQTQFETELHDDGKSGGAWSGSGEWNRRARAWACLPFVRAIVYLGVHAQSKAELFASARRY
jgi:hypothetical protein